MYAWLFSRLRMELRLVETFDTRLVIRCDNGAFLKIAFFGTPNCYETIVMPVPWSPSIMAGERNFF